MSVYERVFVSILNSHLVSREINESGQDYQAAIGMEKLVNQGFKPNSLFKIVMFIGSWQLFRSRSNNLVTVHIWLGRL